MKCPHCKHEISQSEIARELGRHTSNAKKETARANGAAPCRPGKKRGRPRRLKEDDRGRQRTPDAAYLEGYTCKLDSWRNRDNPYPDGILHDQWDLGYAEAASLA